MATDDRNVTCVHHYSYTSYTDNMYDANATHMTLILKGTKGYCRVGSLCNDAKLDSPDIGGEDVWSLFSKHLNSPPPRPPHEPDLGFTNGPFRFKTKITIR